MLSWIFRHRRRLRAIYGVVDAPPLPGSRFASAPPPPPSPGSGPRRRARPGEVRVLALHVVVRPMPPRMAS
jgi:hypothetical protein